MCDAKPWQVVLSLLAGGLVPLVVVWRWPWVPISMLPHLRSDLRESKGQPGYFGYILVTRFLRGKEGLK